MDIFKIYNIIMGLGFTLPIFLFQACIVYNLCRSVLGVREDRMRWTFWTLVLMLTVFRFMPNDTNEIKVCIMVLWAIWMFHGGLAQKVCVTMFGIMIWFYCLAAASLLRHITDSQAVSEMGFQVLTCLAGNILIGAVVKKIGDACLEEDFESDGWLFAAVSIINFLSLGMYDRLIGTNLEMVSTWFGMYSLMVLINVFLFIYYECNILKKKQLKKATEFQKKNELEQLHYQRLEEVQNEFRSLAHDMNHYLNALSNMKEENLSEAQYELAVQIRSKIQETSRNVYCLRPVLNAILNEKAIAAREQDISFEVFVEPGFDLERLDDFSIIGIMSNLIDNAIEAAGKLEETCWVHIHLFAVNDGKQKFIRIENSMLYEPVKKTKGFFSKKENRKQHGLGLKNVQKLVEKNRGILKLQAEDGRFTAEIVF